MGRAKRCNFDHAQKAYIQTIPAHAKSIIREFTLHSYIL